MTYKKIPVWLAVSYRFTVKVEVVKGFAPKAVRPILSNFFDKILRHRPSYLPKETKKLILLVIFLHFDRAMQYSGTISARMAIPITKHDTPLVL